MSEDPQRLNEQRLLELCPLVQQILGAYQLPVLGIHGVIHWARVLENGLRLAESTGADVEVVRLFALFHDSRRVNEGHDREHGLRGAEFAEELRGRHFDVSEEQFKLLQRACLGHTTERTHPDVTIQTCWDADRLDLGRVGIVPDPRRLCTEAARDRKNLLWADGRAGMHVVPDFVSKLWKIDVSQHPF